jgi:hypothetical protein
MKNHKVCRRCREEVEEGGEEPSHWVPPSANGGLADVARAILTWPSGGGRDVGQCKHGTSFRYACEICDENLFDGEEDD